MLLLVCVLLCTGAALAADKRQVVGRSGIENGHEVLVSKYYDGSDACNDEPYDVTEHDITDGMTCLTNGNGMGYYYQRAGATNQTHWRRCLTDNNSCMTNENETCTVWPAPLGSCTKVKYPLDTTKSIYVQYLIETFKAISGTEGERDAVEERFDSMDCFGPAKTTTLIPGSGEGSCVGFASGHSYRAFHNNWDADWIRVCEYSPVPGALELSCQDTAYVCHRYGNGKCAVHPEGGTFKVSLRTPPPTPGAVATDAAPLAALSLAAAAAAALRALAL